MSFSSLECNDLVVNNNLSVYDSSGRKVFWVGDNGANIKELHKSIELDDIIDFPEFRDGLLTCKLNKLNWSKDLSLNNISANDVTLDSLNSKKIKSDYTETITFKSESVVSKSLLTDIATATDGKITNLTNDKLTSKSITADDVKAGKLECDEFRPTEVETDNLLSKQINTEEFNSVSLQSINAGIVNLEAQNVLTQKMQIIESANIKLLNNEEGHIQNLNVENINVDNLKYNKIVNYVKEFGSLEEPLQLNNINIKQLDCNNELGSLRIFNKIHDNIPNNRFELINIPDTDYSITTILHNQHMNANYNFCKINGRTYLMCDFNKQPENLIVELILNKL